MAKVNGKAQAAISTPIGEQKVTPKRARATNQWERGTTGQELEVYSIPIGGEGEDGIRIQRLRRTRTVSEMEYFPKGKYDLQCRREGANGKRQLESPEEREDKKNKKGVRAQDGEGDRTETKEKEEKEKGGESSGLERDSEEDDNTARELEGEKGAEKDAGA